MLDFESKINNTAPSSSGLLNDFEFNSLARNLVNAVKTAGIAIGVYNSPDGNLKALPEAVSRYAAGGAVFYDDAGTANTYVLTTPSGVDGFVMPTGFFEGMEIEFVPGNSSTGPSTVNANGLGGKPILRTNGDPAEENDIVAGVHCAARYSVSDSAFLIAPWALREAAEVSSGGGSGVTGSYLNLELYPEVKDNSGVLLSTSPSAGNLTVSDGGRIIHRGWREYLTTDYDLATRQFTTAANKTYHLRWSPANGFQLKDLANGTYNPSTLDETDEFFDTDYDDMLIARITTDGSNVLTILGLINLAALSVRMVASSSFGGANVYTTGSGSDGVQYCHAFDINWARKPVVHLSGIANQGGAHTVSGFANQVYAPDTIINRYLVYTCIYTDFLSANPINPSGTLKLTAIAV